MLISHSFFHKSIDRFEGDFEFYSMKKIAITGANGFVGSHLVRKLATSYDVLCLVRPNADLRLLPENARLCKIDYDLPEKIAEVLQECDVLIHNAALTRAKNWLTFQKTNIELTEKLLKLSRNMQQFIFISSQAAAGPVVNRLSPMKEEDECQPVSMYGRSKLLAEEIIRQEAEIPWTIIRPVSVFGEGDKDFLQYFKMIKAGIAPRIGFQKKYFHFIYVRELVDLIEKALLNEKAFDQIFFASTDVELTMDQFIASVEKVMNKKSLHLTIPHQLLYPVSAISEFLNRFSTRPPLINREKVKEFRQRYWLASGAKARKMLSFNADADIISQLKETYEWYKQKGWL